MAFQPAAEIKRGVARFQHVGTGVFGATDDVVPRFALRFNHERCDHEVLRVALFYFRDFAEVHFDGAIADELNVIQAHHLNAIQID